MASRRNKRSKKRKQRTILLFFEIIIFIGLIVALFLALKWDRVDKEQLSESEIYYNEELIEKMEEQDSTTFKTMKGFKNVALF
ncbi:MAG: hypothetical protein IJS86_05515, partial [Lachnospiraceae bacterium]|nr:hypothetical protein [Lachnospiraceae bacterium]